MIEILVALGISTIVMAGASAYLFHFFSQYSLFEQWSSVHEDSFESLEKLQNDLRNVILIKPSEDLSLPNDNKYFGLASLAGSEVPSDCLNSVDFNSTRVTILNRKTPPAKTLRLWSEVASSGRVGPVHQLRVVTDGSATALFQASRAPKEIVLVDADRRYSRRYAVVSHTMQLGSNIDPADDINKAPQVFNYAKVYLRNPKDALAVDTPLKSAVFVTSSEVFESFTPTYCVLSANRSLVMKNPPPIPEVELFRVRDQDFSLKSFKFLFARTRLASRVEDSLFVSDIFLPDQQLCTNIMKIQLELESTPARIAKLKSQNIGAAPANIKRSRTLFLPNLNSVRQVNCLN